jgi:HK97 family phage portal protein
MEPEKKSFRSASSVHGVLPRAHWKYRHYHAFANEGFTRNVIAHRSISLLAKAAASVDWQVHDTATHNRARLPHTHPLVRLLEQPYPGMSGAFFFESLYSYRFIAGHAYVLALGLPDAPPHELHLLHPTQVHIVPGMGPIPSAYRYHAGGHTRDYQVDPLTGHSDVLQLKAFHPSDPWYGLSPMEAAAYSIDQHNQAAEWNQSLLQHGARPSGALTVKADQWSNGHLTEEQYDRLRDQMTEMFTGPKNAGRPLVLEGGLSWQPMGMSNREMDFIEAKNSAARDIALAFGVPPQLLGIPGDNTYSNMQEARLAFWEDTVLPLLDHTKDALNQWLSPRFGNSLVIDYDQDSISALTSRRQQVWDRIAAAHFLSDEEKRHILGLNRSNQEAA